ncbi:MAG: OsmC family protein [Anaerolineae bacterium]|nr:OsmC family protein [Anaerolineae bacterium]
MQISAHVFSTSSGHEVSVSTSGCSKTLNVPAKPGGQGSGVNGGEFLMLAIATCYCNDIYREAARLGILVNAVEVEASADFDGIGLAASNVRYSARVSSPATHDQVATLLRETDAVAEVHNTVRKGVPVQLTPWTRQS